MQDSTSLDFKHQVSCKDEIMNNKENNDDDFNEISVTLTKRKKVVSCHSDIHVINEDKLFYHSVHFNF